MIRKNNNMSQMSSSLARGNNLVMQGLNRQNGMKIRKSVTSSENSNTDSNGYEFHDKVNNNAICASSNMSNATKFASINSLTKFLLSNPVDVIKTRYMSGMSDKLRRNAPSELVVRKSVREIKEGSACKREIRSDVAPNVFTNEFPSYAPDIFTAEELWNIWVHCCESLVIHPENIVEYMPKEHWSPNMYKRYKKNPKYCVKLNYGDKTCIGMIPNGGHSYDEQVLEFDRFGRMLNIEWLKQGRPNSLSEAPSYYDNVTASSSL